MIGVVDYYEKPSRQYRDTYLPGQIYWAPIPFVSNEKPKRLRLDHHDPERPKNDTYTLLETDVTTFDGQSDQPLRHLELASDDLLLVTPFKKRPVILMTGPPGSPSDIVANYSGFLVVPCYSIRDQAGNYKPWVTREIILRSKAYQLDSVFYLPSSDEFGMSESLARLDRIQFVRIDHLMPRPVSLTETALNLLKDWTYHFLGAPLFNDALEEFIEDVGARIDTILN